LLITFVSRRFRCCAASTSAAEGVGFFDFAGGVVVASSFLGDLTATFALLTLTGAGSGSLSSSSVSSLFFESFFFSLCSSIFYLKKNTFKSQVELKFE
jgi:hypothetical protein